MGSKSSTGRVKPNCVYWRVMKLKKKGFTLIELIPVLLILSLVMISVSQVLNFGLDTNKKQTIQSDVQSEIREAYVNLSDDIRKGVSFIDTGNIQTESSYNKLYIKYESATDEIYNITHDEGYTGIIFIKQISGKCCLYAKKGKELHRFIFTTPLLTLNKPEGSSASTIDYLTMQYYYTNYKFDYSGSANSSSDFCYYQGQNYFECIGPIDLANNYNIYVLNRSKAGIGSPTDELIASDVKNISVVDETNAYKITITIAKDNSMSGTPYSKTVTSDIAIMNYGGDEDE